ncbi:MAG: LysE family translocator [Burkholderiales bacterium]|nr:LysE family translocator [Burkholderiales bacterium]MCE2646635.1 LysE family translocator [Burkholderiaceae bacterium]
MFGTHDLPLFIATGLVLNATPGVDLLFTLSRTLQQGWRAGVAAALGIGAGCVVHALAAAAGLAALLAASAWAFSAIKWAGAAYLFYLALGLARSALAGGGAGWAGPAVAAASLRQLFLQGFLINALNPKVALFFLALLPQFIAPQAPHKALAFLFLGAVFVVNGTLFLLAVVALAERLRRLPLGGVPAGWLARGLHAGGAALFAGLAVRLALADHS